MDRNIENIIKKTKRYEEMVKDLETRYRYFETATPKEADEYGELKQELDELGVEIKEMLNNSSNEDITFLKLKYGA